MNYNFFKIRLSVTWIKYLGAEEHSIVCDFGDKMYGEIKTSISVWGIVGGYWGYYQVLRIICIDDSLSQIYFTSSWNSSNLYLAVLAIANSFRKLSDWELRDTNWTTK